MVCYKPGKETGLWFEIKCITEDISSKSKKGESCNHEKEVLKALLKKKRMEDAQKPCVRRETSKSDSL